MNYSPPLLLFTAHLETIYPALVRKVNLQHPYQRERITTPDDDFLDLDWLTQNSNKLVIISHGLEGDTERAYVKGMARQCFANGYDVLTWNYRGCSGEMNRQLRFYHSGATDDLHTVIEHAVQLGRFTEINLIGFSLGGNLTLKYLGEERTCTPLLHKAVVISVPVDLHTSCIQISKPGNWIYSQRFLRSLKKKVMEKSKVITSLDTRGLDKIKTLMEFDDHFTGPVHGFKNAIDYYEKSSAIRVIKNITIPTLLINAQNDPFLSAECFPSTLLKDHPFVQFEAPTHGGHVGFAQFNTKGIYWSEARTIAFLHERSTPQ
ncbi:MAG: alpha/beta fold hydrolase [Cyclobacteriaceae bacterium]|nr:alpha/beta fold hydrolase [Cyclobacteriaceae bacterium]UYN85880.1 MAG: alpha/beta fold hydrolase [Cyclobacteriaceae bacterium]